ncbi:hypothetical protein JTB14_026264 [Gonioctena quinquepunctata]|nr:hypothetical protein JTB14_026264 [Gonioctena quinquepunctata]
MFTTKSGKNKKQKLPSKWLPGRKHLILAETGVESVLVPLAGFYFNPFHPYKYGALIASIPSRVSSPRGLAQGKHEAPNNTPPFVRSTNSTASLPISARFKLARQFSAPETNERPARANGEPPLYVVASQHADSVCRVHVDCCEVPVHGLLDPVRNQQK